MKQCMWPPPWLVDKGWCSEWGWVTSRRRRGKGWIIWVVALECLVEYCPIFAVTIRFLFKEASFTLINMATLMFLEVPWASLCMVLQQSGITGWPVELLCGWMGYGALRCSLILSPKVFPDSPMYASGQLILGYLKW